MSARLGIVTQMGLGEAVAKQFQKPFLKWASILLVGGAIGIGNYSYAAGDLSGTALGLSTITGAPVRTLAPFIGIFVLLLIWRGSYKFIEKFMTFLVVVMALVFVITMFVAKPDLGGIARGLIPTIPSGGIMIVIGLIGTTIAPYNFFIHSVSAKESWGADTDKLPLSKFDTYASICVGGIITAAIVITSGTLMRGMTISTAADLSIQLEPLLGSWAKPFLGIGLFAAGLSSALASPLGVSYTLAGLLGWKVNNSDKRFLYTNMSVVVFGVIVTLTGINPLTIILFAQALNGIILPVIVIYLVFMTNSKKLLGEFSNSLFARIVGYGISLVTIVLGASSLISAIQAFIS